MAIPNTLLAKQALNSAACKGKTNPLIWSKQNSIQFVIMYLLQLLAIYMVAWAHVEEKVHQLAPRREEKVCLSYFPPFPCQQPSSHLSWLILEKTQL